MRSVTIPANIPGIIMIGDARLRYKESAVRISVFIWEATCNGGNANLMDGFQSAGINRPASLGNEEFHFSGRSLRRFVNTKL